MSNEPKIDIMVFAQKTKEEAKFIADKVPNSKIVEVRIMKGFTPENEACCYLVMTNNLAIGETYGSV